MGGDINSGRVQRMHVQKRCYFSDKKLSGQGMFKSGWLLVA